MTEEMDHYKRSQARAYLKRVGKLGIKCKAIKAEIDYQRDLVGGLRGIDYTQSYTKTSCAGDDPTVNAVVRLQELIRDYCAELASYTAEVAVAHECLGRMGSVGADVLRLHYLCGHSWEEVGARVEYAPDYARGVARSALVEFYKFMPHAERDPMHPAL